ncbi:NAD(P)H-hydrate dehydratase, partial [Proteus mirabilis]|uniref:NAD(P)H-hydrate dehydratase n=1 Tax=Proteus mirabilis TaxID=584 RepID=UPI0023B7AD04
ADALNALAEDAALQALVRARPAGTTLLTPHPLEAARLLGRDTVGVQANRLAAAHELAERLGCTVVLK